MNANTNCTNARISVFVAGNEVSIWLKEKKKKMKKQKIT